MKKSPALLLLLLAFATLAHAADAGLGRKPIESFGLEKNPPSGDHSTAKLTMPKVDVSGLSADLLKSRPNGRVQLFSVSQLSDQDMMNPFQIRVQVAVDVRETTFEIGGIIESPADGCNTVFIMCRPPETRKAGEAGPETENGTEKNPGETKPAEKQKLVSRVCSVGDEVEGFRIHAIMRDSIIVEQSGKFVEIVRGGPVTVCVPVSHNL